MYSRFIRFCPRSDVPRGGRKHARIEGRCVLVCHSGEQLYAVSAVCSHQQKPLVRGRVRNGKITCPVHGARFDLETGEPLDLPATAPIPVYELRVVDGWIEVRLPLNE